MLIVSGTERRAAGMPRAALALPAITGQK